jgi:hypothetical protein
MILVGGLGILGCGGSSQEEKQEEKEQKIAQESIPKIMDQFPLLQSARDADPDDTFGCAPEHETPRGFIVSCGFKSQVLDGWKNYLVTPSGEVGRIDGGGEFHYPPDSEEDATDRIKAAWTDSVENSGTYVYDVWCQAMSDVGSIYKCTIYLGNGERQLIGVQWQDNGTIESEFVDLGY